MRFSGIASAAFCVFLVGCDQAALMKKFTPPEDESVARRYVELLRQGKFDQIERNLDPSVADTKFRDTFSKMAAFFPAGTPESVKVVGAYSSKMQVSPSADITLEYQFPGKWLLVEVVTLKKGGASTVTGFRVTPIPDSLENLNKFTIAGKSPLQYFTLACAAASFLFTLYVLFLCIRSRDMKRKWLWSIVVLVGVGKLAVNWGTGQWTYQLVAIQIPCFSMSHPLYGAWTVAAYVPLGAIAFLQWREKTKITGQSIAPSAPSE